MAHTCSASPFAASSCIEIWTAPDCFGPHGIHIPLEVLKKNMASWVFRTGSNKTSFTCDNQGKKISQEHLKKRQCWLISINPFLQRHNLLKTHSKRHLICNSFIYLFFLIDRKQCTFFFLFWNSSPMHLHKRKYQNQKTPRSCELNFQNHFQSNCGVYLLNAPVQIKTQQAWWDFAVWTRWLHSQKTIPH